MRNALVACLAGLVAVTAATAVSAHAGATGGLVREQRAAGNASLRAAAPRIPAPVRQLLRNNCESAALSMLLAAAGVRVDQLTLQRRLPRSGPLDPRPRGAGQLPVWGDPDLGFVGRANGGGTSGGFGVYTRPIRRLALRYGVNLVSLTRAPPALLYRRLRLGRPVMVWVGLSQGPYGRWLSPQGKTIGVNFGEHTVVLTAVRGSQVLLNDPLVGRRRIWTRAYFEQLWARLGRRALGL